MDYAFEFITKQKGITTEANYPYRAQDGHCDAIKVFFHIQLIWLMEVVNCPSMISTKCPSFYVFCRQTSQQCLLMDMRMCLIIMRMHY